MAAISLGCSQPRDSGGEVLETVDVAEGVDSQIRPEDDIQAEQREREFLGVLPGDFPDDFWVYRPGSIVDLGSEAGGRAFVALRTLGSLEDVRERLIKEERARGWQESAVGSSLVSFTKEDRRIDLALERKGNETWIRIEYEVGGSGDQ